MRELLEPPAALVEHGRIHFGTHTGPIADVNLIDARPWSWPVPRALRALRLKEWQAFQFGNDQWFFVVALFDAKLMALAQLKAYDRANRRKHVFERQLPSWTMRAPRNLLNSSMSYVSDDASIRFVNELERGRITISLELPETANSPAISGQLRVLADGCEPEVVSIPFAENRGMYSHKCCMALDGQLRIGEQQLRFSAADSFALMDDHKGYYPRIMRWDWVTGAGFDAQGRRIGLNLTRNDSIDPERYNENCLWIDGRLHLLPPVTFTRGAEPNVDPLPGPRRPSPAEPFTGAELDADSSPELWQIRDQAGDVAVDFELELDGHVRVNAVVIESRYRGPFGHLRGYVRTGAGERVELDGLFGMGEDFYLKC